jgi:UDP-glucuronate 4-epimerase
MAYFSFTRKIMAGEPIPVFNEGQMMRDFTYIDDIIDGVIATLHKIPTVNDSWDGDSPDPATSYAPYRVYNIGHNQPEQLLHMIQILEEAIGKRAYMEMLPMQDGDVKATYANIDALKEVAGFKPKTNLKTGIAKFVEWYKSYYR